MIKFLRSNGLISHPQTIQVITHGN